MIIVRRAWLYEYTVVCAMLKNKFLMVATVAVRNVSEPMVGPGVRRPVSCLYVAVKLSHLICFLRIVFTAVL